jgi:hypothetical protein
VTLNAFAQLSKYFWAVMSFSGEPSSDGFMKRYELHYQLKKVIVGVLALSTFMRDKVVGQG